MQLGKRMEAEIREQPHVLRGLDRRLPGELRSLNLRRDYEQVVLIGRGSSDNAALYLRYLVEVYLQIPAILAAPSVATVYGREVRFRRAIGVAISQSGESQDVRAVVSIMKSQGHDTLAITNTADSPLAAEAGFHICLDVGAETSIAATKTYTASLLAAYRLAQALGADLGEPNLPDEPWVEDCRLLALSAAPQVVACDAVFALARGLSFSSAEETALKLIECALIPCQSYSSADFEHGPLAIAGKGVGVIAFGEPPASLAGTGCQVIGAPNLQGRADAPIKEIVFSQFLALEAARLKGIDPDHARHLKKVTSTY